MLNQATCAPTVLVRVLAASNGVIAPALRAINAGWFVATRFNPLGNALRPKEMTMSDRLTAGRICTPVVTVAYRGVVVSEAARQMRESHVGCLVVVEEDDPGRVVVGILTDRDIVVSVVAKDRDARLMSVGEVMSTDVVTARQEDSVIDLLELMGRKGVRRLPVTGPQGVLIGLVALDDLLPVIAGEMQAMASAIGSARKHESAVRP